MPRNCLWWFLLLAFVQSGRANDDQLIFAEYTNVVYGTRTYNNGWQDNGWVPLRYTNNPVHSGTNALCLAPSGSWQALHFVHGDIDTSLYTNLTFWINGGISGGQSVQVGGTLDGAEQARVSVGTVPTNAWRQVTLSLASLGVANKTNFDGLEFWVSFGNSQPPVYLDDLQLVARTAPVTVNVSVNVTQAVRTVDARVFGVNQVAWDGEVNTATTVGILNDLGNPCLRWPGGSWGDGYHWTNEYRGWGSYSSDFIKLATNTHAQAFIIVNYGSSSPEEAAFGVRMFNVTNRCGFKYWEVGNEVGGSWETDNNTNAPWKPHDPWTYAMRFTNYYAQMKAVDPTIKIGAVADVTEDGTANYTDHPVVNPRTGVTHNGWTPVMLSYLRSNNVLPDFLIIHKYAPGAGDTSGLLWSKTWAADAASVRQMLTDYLGSAGTNVTLECTENGGSGDRQRTSLVGGLFYADSIGQILQTEFNSRIWWDTRNGPGAIANSDPALYGWRTNSSGAYIYDEGIVYGQGYPTNRYPTYYVGKLMPNFAGGGDTVVKATSDYALLSAYAVQRTNGTLALLVINKSSYTNLTASLALNGYMPLTNVAVYAYGIPQDEAARTNGAARDVVKTAISNAAPAFSCSFPPYSATVLSLSPLGPAIGTQPVSRTVVAGSNAVFAVGAFGKAPLTYQWRRNGTNLAGATGSSFTVTNAQLTNSGNYSVMVTNAAGSIASAAATLTVLQPPQIDKQPRSQAATAGGRASFSVVASGQAPLSYQWQTNGIAWPGQTNANLSLDPVQVAHFANYTVRVTNLAGTVLSEIARLTPATSPTLLARSLNPAAFSLTFPTETGPDYVVECKSEVTSPQWEMLGTFAGTGWSLTMTNEGLTNAMRFYRVRVR